jgi:rhomboid family protein
MSFTATFRHGGVMHIISNMVFLAAFARMVEDAMGRGKYQGAVVLRGVRSRLLRACAGRRARTVNS